MHSYALVKGYMQRVGETVVGWDTFHFFTNIAENIYDRLFRNDTTGKGNPFSTNIITKLCCPFIHCNKIRCQRHVIELSRSRGRHYIGTVPNVCVLRAHSQTSHKC